MATIGFTLMGFILLGVLSESKRIIAAHSHRFLALLLPLSFSLITLISYQSHSYHQSATQTLIHISSLQTLALYSLSYLTASCPPRRLRQIPPLLLPTPPRNIDRFPLVDRPGLRRFWGLPLPFYKGCPNLSRVFFCGLYIHVPLFAHTLEHPYQEHQNFYQI